MAANKNMYGIARARTFSEQQRSAVADSIRVTDERVSTRYAIEILDPLTRTRQISAVRERVNGIAVTKEMLKSEVAQLNANCARNGRTAARLATRRSVYRLVELQ